MEPTNDAAHSSAPNSAVFGFRLWRRGSLWKGPSLEMVFVSIDWFHYFLFFFSFFFKKYFLSRPLSDGRQRPTAEFFWFGFIRRPFFVCFFFVSGGRVAKGKKKKRKRKTEAVYDRFSLCFSHVSEHTHTHTQQNHKTRPNAQFEAP